MTPDDYLQKILFGEVKEMEMSIFEITDYFVENNKKIDDDIELFKQNHNKICTAKHLFYPSAEKKRLL